MKATLTKFESYEALKNSKVYKKKLTSKAIQNHNKFRAFIDLLKANIISAKS